MEEKRDFLEGASTEAYDPSDKPFDYVEEGKETVLLCEPDPGNSAKISNMLREAGYLVTEPSSTHDALAKMQFHTYHLILINEKYEATETGENEVLKYVNKLPMGTRRKTFVILTGNGFRTMDKMTAFNKSVNLVLDMEHLDDLEAILLSSRGEHNLFYFPFMNTMQKLGLS